MMKDCFDAVADVRSLLELPELTDHISGKIWQFQRPANSDKIDIVIGLLVLSNEQFQDGVVNIRIHAPNISVTANGQVSSMPDLSIFNKLEKIILPMVDTQYKHSFSTYVIEPGKVMQNTDGRWFMLIQINYNSYNTDYTNI